MKRPLPLIHAIVLGVGVWLAAMLPAAAQNPQTVKLCVPTSATACANVTASAPLPVAGSFSATLAGFTPNGNYTTLTATASSSASTALPAGEVVAFQNLSTIDVSCVLSAGAATATTNKLIVRGGATVYYTVGSNVNAACINQTGSASNVVGLAGGTGLGTAFGGGGSGGGGGAVTMASSAVASGAYSSGSIAAGAMVDLLTMRGTVAAGTAASNSILAGCVYNSTPITLTNTQGSAAQCDANGFQKVNVTNTNANGRATAANSSPVVPVAAASTAGAIQPNNTTAVVVKGSAGTLFGIQLGGIGSAPAYVKIYNATSATCGSGTPVKRLIIPAAATAANGAGSNITFSPGLAFSTGITYCVTTGIGDSDTTAAAASTFLINFDYE